MKEKKTQWSGQGGNPNLLQWLSLLLTLLLLSRHERNREPPILLTFKTLPVSTEHAKWVWERMVFLYSSHFKSGFGTHFEFCEFWRWRQLNIGTSASPYNERLLELSKPIWSSHDVSMDYMTGKRHNILCKLRRWLDTPIVLWQYVWMPGKEGLNKKGLIPPRTPVGLWKSSAGKAKMSCYKRAHFLTGHVKEGQLPLSFHKVLQKNILLMVQKSGEPVEVGSLSHCF